MENKEKLNQNPEVVENAVQEENSPVQEVTESLTKESKDVKAEEAEGEVKEKVEAIIKQPSQVVTNYMKKFRDKGVLNKENVLSPIFKHKEIKIVRYED